VTLAPSDDETLDDFLRGRIKLLQPRKGARVSIDPLLLADFVASPIHQLPARPSGPRGARDDP
jgi:hypothetical protein